MATGINAKPNFYPFGRDFNYASWAPNSRVDLVNVTWANTYRDGIRFSDPQAQVDYFDNLSSEQITIDNIQPIYPGRPVTLSVPYNRALQFNYMRVTNGSNPTNNPIEDVPREYYYFILGVDYGSSDATTFSLELDVWTTFQHDIRLLMCYVQQGHVGVANNRRMQNYGRDYLTTPEGLDTGADYVTATEDRTAVFSPASFDVLITSSLNLTADPGTVVDPKINSATGSRMHGVELATTTYVLRGNTVQDYFRQMSQFPWIVDGIISIKVVPVLSSLDVQFQYNFVTRQPVGASSTMYPPGGTGATLSYIAPANIANTTGDTYDKPLFREAFNPGIPQRYRHLDKFKVSPYSVIELTNETANSIVAKPELVQSEDMSILRSVCLIPSAERIGYRPRNYNNEGRAFEVVFSGLPELPVIKNNALLAQAQSAHTTNQQMLSAEWSQQKALSANQNAFDNTGLSTDASQAQGRLSRNTATSQTALNNSYLAQNAAFSAAGGVVQGAGAGGAIGGPAGAGLGLVAGAGNAAMSGMQTARNIQQANESLALQNSASRSSENISTELTNTISANNKGLADFAAKGDYQGSVAAINAKLQDMQMIPPTMQNQIGGDMANFIRSVSLVAKYKTIDGAAVRRVGEYWLRYGYAVNQFHKPTRLNVMSKFSYWKMTETYIEANIPEFYKNVIRGIFEKGITLWENPNDIGNIDIADNQILPGVTL